MEDVKFEIDEETKTVTPIFPEISVNIEALLSTILENAGYLMKW